MDAGTGHPDHVNEIAACLAGTNLDRVLLTHGHPDHASGVPAITMRWPTVEVLRYPHFGSAPIHAGDTELQPVHTPGHSPDHVCFFDPVSGDLYCGDLVRRGGSIVIPASRGGHVGQYLASLERVRALSPHRLLPAHGEIIDDPVTILDEYIAHRRMREQQVLDAMRAGRSTADEITAAVYAGLSPALAAAAADTVLAHLQYLEETGRATRDGVRWAHIITCYVLRAPGTRNPNPEPGTRNPEPGTRNPELSSRPPFRRILRPHALRRVRRGVAADALELLQGTTRTGACPPGSGGRVSAVAGVRSLSRFRSGLHS